MRTVRQDDDRGFTLPELVMVIALMGLIMAAITAAIIVTLGPDAEASDRLAFSHDVQLAARWIPNDIKNAGNDGDDVRTGTVATVGTCADPLPGGSTNRLYLEQESTGFAVSYRTIFDDGEWQLVRHLCQSGVHSSNVVAHNLFDGSAASVAVTVNGARVKVVLTSSNGVTYEITGARRMFPAGGCAVTAMSVAPPIVAQIDPAGHLGHDVVVTIETAGACGTVEFEYAPSGGTVTRTFPAGSPSSITILAADHTWAVGVHRLAVNEGGHTREFRNLAVNPIECSITELTADPAIALRNGTDLSDEVDVTMSATAGCEFVPLELVYERSPGDEQVLAVTAPDFAVTIPIDGPWDLGDVILTVRRADVPADLATAVFTVADPVLDHFDVDAPATATAGEAFTVTITARHADGSTFAGYDGVQCISFSGPGPSPNGMGPTYPDAGGCPAGGNGVTFNNGEASVVVRLHLAEAAVLTVTEAGKTGASDAITISAAEPDHLAYTNADCPGGEVSVGDGGTFTAHVSVFDEFGNLAVNTTGADVTILVANSPTDGTLTGTPLTLLDGSSETTTALSFTMPSGGPLSITLTAEDEDELWPTASCMVTGG